MSTPTTDTDKCTSESLDNFLNRPHVKEFLDRENIARSEVTWFAKHHIGEDRRARYTPDEVGVVSVMFLTGMCLKTSWKSRRDVRQIDGCARILGVLGFDPKSGPGEWYELYNEVKDEESLSKQMMYQVERIHGLAEQDVNQRVILACGEIRLREDWEDEVDDEERTRIAERHDTTLDQVMDFKRTFEEEYDE